MSRARRLRARPPRSGDELLRDFADGRLDGAAVDDASAVVVDPGGRITRDALRFAQIAALAAVDAPAMAWLAQLEHDSTSLDPDEIAAVLVAVAPIIGGPRVVSAAETALAATRFAEDTGPL
jgi:hypothetical protein